MDISIQQQILLFAYAAVLGVFLSAVFDIFRILRLTLNFNIILILIQDLIYFFLSASVAFMFFFLYNDGEIRLYILIAIIMGWIMYYLTAGRLVFFIAKITTDWLKKHIKIFINWVKQTFKIKRIEK